MCTPISLAATRAFLRRLIRSHRDQSSAAPDQSGSDTSVASTVCSTRFVVSHPIDGGNTRQSASAAKDTPGATRQAMKTRRRSLATIAYSSVAISFASQSLMGFTAAWDRLLMVASMVSIVVGALALGAAFGCALAEQGA